MKKDYEITKTVTVDEEQLSCLLSNACADVCGVQWWKAADQEEYDKAKSELISELKPNAKNKICMENVWARMLLNGGKLRLLDPESDWHWKGHKVDEMLWNWQIKTEGTYPVGGEWHDVGIEDILKAIEQYGKEGYANDCGADLEKIVEDGDFYDADAVIQIAMYGEVIYG